MSKKPRAVRMADVFEACLTVGGKYAAAELRRAHAQNERLRRLHEVNQELLFWMRYILSKDHVGHIHDTARAAIAKATGEAP